MSEHNNSSPIEASSELVRWLQLLVLPLWARVGLLVVMALIVAGGLALLGVGLVEREKESFVAAITMLTVALPVMLVVVALVFGQNGEKRLKTNTFALLDRELPQALEVNLGSPLAPLVIGKNVQGCRGDYELSFKGSGLLSGIKLNFSVELNVRKVNLAFWLNAHTLPGNISLETSTLQPFRHVIAGALAEGYRMNDTPAKYLGSGKGNGVLFFRDLDPDFLIKPAARLYFCQDLSFFVRGVIEAEYASSHHSDLPASAGLPS